MRIFNSGGPLQTAGYGMVLPRFIVAARVGRSLRVNGGRVQTRCFSHVAATVAARLRLRACPGARGEVFNVGGSEEVEIGEPARRVIRLVGSSSCIDAVPHHVASGPGVQDMG